MRKGQIGALAIAGTYIGTVVGAGFASGQEILQFFTLQGVASFPSLCLSAFLFFFFGLAILEAGYKLKARSHAEVTRWAAGDWGGRLLDLLITFFLFATLAVMAAGAGALLTEQFALPPLAGRVILLGLTLLTVLAGFSGVVTSISLVAPVLVTGALFLGVCLGLKHPPDWHELKTWSSLYRPAIPFGPLSVLVYVSYNLVMAVCVLAPLGARAGGEGALRWGALGGALGLFLGSAAINLGLLSFPWEAVRFEVPMVHLAGQFSPWVQGGYALILLAEVYTTAVASLFGLVNRLVPGEGRFFRFLALLAALAAFGVSLLGFASLVRYLYAAVGLAGLFFLGSILWRRLKVRDCF
ncbi:hypothetical protein [Ammonifex thiophilus]|uniref:Membrane protein YkvI n=1 Tax=Ammonifex thiophilus TaxID=444093 RepID=A0A3D8P4X6_9THEO|nr:hypothetical protein [Ammonifex thiophilus]RDV82866.1 hypothetical protein DXX99_06580 [Ammonifex thiophilus]